MRRWPRGAPRLHDGVRLGLCRRRGASARWVPRPLSSSLSFFGREGTRGWGPGLGDHSGPEDLPCPPACGQPVPGVRPGPAVAGSPDGLEGQARVAEAGRGAAFGRGWSGVSAGIGPPPRFGALARVGGRASRWRPWGLPAGRWAPERFPVAAGGPAGPGLPLLSPPCSSLFAACVAAGGSAWSVWMEGSSECIPRAVTSPGMNF